jgi:parvulin-like peptidyl-prolyl isomerase
VSSFRPRLAAAALVAVLASACAGGDPNLAASVNGTDIALSDVQERLDALEQNPQVAQQIQDDAVRQQAEAEVLTSLIQFQLLEQGAEELGVEVGQAEVDEQRAALVEQLGGEEAFDQVVEQNGLSEEQVQFELRRAALQEAVSAELSGDAEVTDEQVQTFYDQNQDRFGPTATVRHLLVEDEAAAQQALERIRGGEDFAAVARELSTDTTSAERGGDLGELSRGDTVPEFDEAVFSAPVGEVVGPVQSQFGYHVLEVTEREDEGQPLEEVEGEIREELAQGSGQQAFQTFLQERAADAEVEVNPRFGEWNAEQGAVLPADPLGDAQAPASAPAAAPSE